MELNYGSSMEMSVVVREYDGERDLEEVEKLERNCEIGSRRGFSIITNMMGDPLCRVRLFPLHVMLVAEFVGVGEIVGVVRGCMKCVGTGLGAGNVWIGCILGLRVSPKHRRMGIGLKLMKSIEAWAVRNGAEYILLATDENNVASINLFSLKCHYVKLSSLAIFVQLTDTHPKIHAPSNDVAIEKLSIEQAILLYKDRLANEKFFPLDIDNILNEELSLGTWVSYYKGERWSGLHCKGKDGEFLNNTPSSWAVVSMWKTYDSYKFQVKATPLFRCIHASLKQIGPNFLHCLRIPLACKLPLKLFGFLFLYGLHGEGDNVRELLNSLWCFAFNMVRDVRDCKAIVSEVSLNDPLYAHMPWVSSTSCINDIWFFKRVGTSKGVMKGEENWVEMNPRVHCFVDPRDF
ncbi:probable N-acetyltransferase HLS1 isoform X2 [Ananas comosus]|uniref:Probable N-acetyltransferase HLS1 isoform X2 n=1 Tax=Ananas comosus TaxID=4615 RepID=A0A6P5GZX9_ANACO|nr:probable N-acetyltransferase HLS1 isoform X2 [Ananas comosus]